MMTEKRFRATSASLSRMDDIAMEAYSNYRAKADMATRLATKLFEAKAPVKYAKALYTFAEKARKDSAEALALSTKLNKSWIDFTKTTHYAITYESALGTLTLIMQNCEVIHDEFKPAVMI